MKIDDKIDYTLISSDENSFLEFFTEFKKKYNQYEKKHLIIKILENFNPSKENILLFLPYCVEHQQNGISFVIVTKGVNIDDFPETFNIVPTLVEAEDVIEMENMQRELGF